MSEKSEEEIGKSDHSETREKLRKQLDFLRNDIESLNGFVLNTKNELKYQGNVVGKMIQAIFPKI